jgi:hypothetical protein
MNRTQRSSRTRRRAPIRDEPEPRRRRRRRVDQPKERKQGRAEHGFLFDDPYWDDAFGSYYDPTLSTCCRI